MKLLVTLLSATCLLIAASAAPTKGPEPLRIAQGAQITLADYLVPGKMVIFDFTSKYCPPCRAYDEPLHQLHAKRDDLVVIKVDINRPDVKGIDWKSPVARQFALHSIPHFKVFGPDGKLLAEDKITFGSDGKPTNRENKGRMMVDRWIGGLK